MTLQEALSISNWVIKKSAGEKFRFRASHRDMVDQNNSCHNFSAVELVCHNDWEPYKEPCKHEPISQINYINLFVHECKHCGVKLKAEKWVEA
nr:hypothetical protein BdHM001_18530 [Bdellovibrio sp. HM001]